jgi:hypothetical protein
MSNKQIIINDWEYENYRDFLSKVDVVYYEHNYETKKIIIKYKETDEQEEQ